MINIKDKAAEQEYKRLVNLSEENKAEFLAVQDKARNIKLQLEAKKSQLREIELQNQQIEDELDNVKTNEAGEVDFSNFEKSGRIISENKVKAKIIEKHINKDEIELKLTLINEISESYLKYQASVFNLNRFLYLTLFKQLLEDNKTIETIRILLILLNNKDNIIYKPEELRKVFIKELNQYMHIDLTGGITIKGYPVLINSEFEIEHLSGFKKSRLVEELRQQLNELNQ